jgi:hypothetical protein
LTAVTGPAAAVFLPSADFLEIFFGNQSDVLWLFLWLYLMCSATSVVAPQLENVQSETPQTQMLCSQQGIEIHIHHLAKQDTLFLRRAYPEGDFHLSKKVVRRSTHETEGQSSPSTCSAFVNLKPTGSLST